MIVSISRIDNIHLEHYYRRYQYMSLVISDDKIGQLCYISTQYYLVYSAYVLG